MARDGDDQPGSTARRGEGERLPDGSNGLADVLISKYRLLHPGERRILEVRKHPAVLVWNIFLTLAVLAAAGLVSSYVSSKAGKNGNVAFSITFFHRVEKVDGNQATIILYVWVDVWPYPRVPRV